MSYIDAFLLPVARDAKDIYAAKAAEVGAAFRRHGALQVVECWGDDRPDFAKTVCVADDQNVVLSWIVWPSKEVRDAGHAALQADDRLGLGDPLFNPPSMLWSGFKPLVASEKEYTYA